MTIPAELRYTSDHEWVAVDGDVATVGITDFAQNALGDVVFISLPEVGDTITAGDVVGEIESTKSVSDLVAPVSGEVVEANAAALEATDLLNSDPFGEGWLVRVRFSEDGDAHLWFPRYELVTHLVLKSELRKAQIHF